MNLFRNAFCFYHRIVGVIFSHNEFLGRAYKALNTATQMAIVPAIICTLGTYSTGNAFMSARITYTVFGVMRLVQTLLTLGLNRG